MEFTTRYKSHHDASKELKQHFTLELEKENYLEEVLNKQANNDRVLYIHVPFCNKICSFCPFHTPEIIQRKNYEQFLIEQIESISAYPYMQKQISAINFGGGTPTALEPKQIDAILTSLYENFNIKENAEISLESSITELDDEMLQVLLNNGVNRLSLGVQTFQDNTRKILNRRGNGKTAIETIEKVVSKGIVNTNIDLIYNYPNQSVADLKKDLEIIKSLPLAGLSLYSLMIHDKTPLATRLSDYERALMLDTTHEYQLFETIFEQLQPEGYELFELTKLIHQKKDRYDYMRVRHNQGSCIAIGYGAGGNIDDYIYRNAHDYNEISKAIRISSMGRIVDHKYFIIDQLINEMQKGKIAYRKYSQVLGIDLEKLFHPMTQQLTQRKMIFKTQDGFEMTVLGVFWGNNIINEMVHLLLTV